MPLFPAWLSTLRAQPPLFCAQQKETYNYLKIHKKADQTARTGVLAKRHGQETMRLKDKKRGAAPCSVQGNKMAYSQCRSRSMLFVAKRRNGNLQFIHQLYVCLPRTNGISKRPPHRCGDSEREISVLRFYLLGPSLRQKDVSCPLELLHLLDTWAQKLERRVRRTFML
jgi:hypothetical protein